MWFVEESDAARTLRDYAVNESCRSFGCDSESGRSCHEANNDEADRSVGWSLLSH